MTAAAGAALSHAMIRGSRGRFSAAPASGFFSARGKPDDRFAENRRRQFVPAPDAWLHEACEGNTAFGPAIPSSSILGEFSPFQAMTSLASISKYN
jgi:hypothetical protein